MGGGGGGERREDGERAVRGGYPGVGILSVKSPQSRMWNLDLGRLEWSFAKNNIVNFWA